MMNNRFDLGDLLIFIGVAMALVGLYLLNWRLVLVFGGLLVMFTGLVRVRYNGRYEND